MDKSGAQIIYFSHGGGPLPILNDPGHASMNDFMTKLPTMIRRPEAIIVFSAHWEENKATLQTAESPTMLYDYYGFPKEAYEIQYPAKNSKDFLQKVRDAMDNSGLEYMENSSRGYDHGLYIPLKMMYPDADIPAFQISLLHNLSPRDHIELGKALVKLKDENILIIGSGFSFHNLMAFPFSGHETDERNDAFQHWLIDTCTSSISEDERLQKLVEWETAPYARYCHPRHEHLLPLHVCAGIAQTKAQLIFDDYIAGKRGVAFLWD